MPRLTKKQVYPPAPSHIFKELIRPLSEANERYIFNWLPTLGAGDPGTTDTGRVIISAKPGERLNHQASFTVERLRNGSYSIAGNIIPYRVMLAGEDKEFVAKNEYQRQVDEIYRDSPRPSVFENMVGRPVSGMDLFTGRVNMALKALSTGHIKGLDINKDLQAIFSMPFSNAYTRLSSDTGGADNPQMTYVIGASEAQVRSATSAASVSKALKMNNLIPMGIEESDKGYWVGSYMAAADVAERSGFTNVDGNFYKFGSPYNPNKDIKLLQRHTRDRYITPENQIFIQNNPLPTYNRTSPYGRELVMGSVAPGSQLARLVGLEEGRTIGSDELMRTGSVSAPTWQRFDLPVDADLNTLEFAGQPDVSALRQNAFMNISVPPGRFNRLLPGAASPLFKYMAGGKEIVASAEAKGYLGRVYTKAAFDVGSTPSSVEQALNWVYGDADVLSANNIEVDRGVVGSLLRANDNTGFSSEGIRILEATRELFQQKAASMGLGSYQDDGYEGLQFIMPHDMRRSGGAGFRQNQISYSAVGIIGSGDTKNLAMKGVAAWHPEISLAMGGQMIIAGSASLSKARGILQQRHDWSMKYDSDYAKWYKGHSKGVTAKDFVTNDPAIQAKNDAWWASVGEHIEASAARWRRGTIKGLEGMRQRDEFGIDYMDGPARLAEMRSIAGADFDEKHLFPVITPAASAEWSSKSALTIHDLLADSAVGLISDRRKSWLSRAFMRSPHFALLTASDMARRDTASQIPNFLGFAPATNMAPADQMRVFTNWLEKAHGVDPKSLNPLRLTSPDGATSRFVPHPHQLSMLAEDRQAVASYMKMVGAEWSGEGAEKASRDLMTQVADVERRPTFREELMKARSFGLYNTFSADPRLSGSSQIELGPAQIATMLEQSGGGKTVEQFLAESGLSPDRGGILGSVSVRRDPALGAPVRATAMYVPNMPAGPLNIDPAFEQAMGADSDGDALKILNYLSVRDRGFRPVDRLGMLKAGLANLAGMGGLDFTMNHLKQYPQRADETNRQYLERMILGVGATSTDEILNPILGGKGQNIAVDRLDHAKQYPDTPFPIKTEDMIQAKLSDIQAKHAMGIFNAVWSISDTMKIGTIDGALGDQYKKLSAMTGRGAGELLRSRVASSYQFALDKQKLPKTLSELQEAFNFRSLSDAMRGKSGEMQTNHHLASMYEAKWSEGPLAGQYVHTPEEIALYASRKDNADIGLNYSKIVAGRANGASWESLGMTPGGSLLNRVLNASAAISYSASMEKGKIRINPESGVPEQLQPKLIDGRQVWKPLSRQAIEMVQAGLADKETLNSVALRRRRVPTNAMFRQALASVGGEFGDAIAAMVPGEPGVSTESGNSSTVATSDNTETITSDSSGSGGNGGGNGGGGGFIDDEPEFPDDWGWGEGKNKVVKPKRVRKKATPPVVPTAAAPSDSTESPRDLDKLVSGMVRSIIESMSQNGTRWKKTAGAAGFREFGRVFESIRNGTISTEGLMDVSGFMGTGPAELHSAYRQLAMATSPGERVKIARSLQTKAYRFQEVAIRSNAMGIPEVWKAVFTMFRDASENIGIAKTDIARRNAERDPRTPEYAAARALEREREQQIQATELASIDAKINNAVGVSQVAPDSSPLAKAGKAFVEATKDVEDALNGLRENLEGVGKVSKDTAKNVGGLLEKLDIAQSKQARAVEDIGELSGLDEAQTKLKITQLRRGQALGGSVAGRSALSPEQADRLEEVKEVLSGRRASGRNWAQRLTSGMYLFGMMRDFRLTMQPILEAGDQEYIRRQQMGQMMINLSGGESLVSIYGNSFRGAAQLTAAGANMRRGAANISGGFGSMFGSAALGLTSNPFIPIAGSAAAAGVGAAAAISLTGSALASATLSSLALPVGIGVAALSAYAGYRGYADDVTTRAGEIMAGNSWAKTFAGYDAQELGRRLSAQYSGSSLTEVIARGVSVPAGSIAAQNLSSSLGAGFTWGGGATGIGVGITSAQGRNFSPGQGREALIQAQVDGAEGFGDLFTAAGIYKREDKEALLKMAYGSGVRTKSQMASLIQRVGAGQSIEDAVSTRLSLGMIMAPNTYLAGGISNVFADNLDYQRQRQYVQSYSAWGDQIGWRMGLGSSSVDSIRSAAGLALSTPTPGMQLASQQMQGIVSQLSLYGGRSAAQWGGLVDRFALGGTPLNTQQISVANRLAGGDIQTTARAADLGYFLNGQDWRTSTRADVRNPGFALFQNSLSGISQSFDRAVSWSRDPMGIAKPFVPGMSGSQFSNYVTSVLSASNPLFAALASSSLAPSSDLMAAVIGDTYAGKGGIEGAQEYMARRSYNRALGGLGISQQELALSRAYELQTNRPYREFGLGLQWATQFGGPFQGHQWTGSFGFQQQELQFARQSSAIQYSRTLQGFQWEWQGMGLGRQGTLLSRGAQAYDLSYQQVDLQLGHLYFQQDWALNQNKRQLQFGWQMEDSERNIRRATGFEKQQLIRERSRAVEMYNLDSTQLNRERSREEARFKREEERWNVQRRRFEEQNALEDKRWALELEQFAKRQEWAETDRRRELEAQDRQQKQYEENRRAAELQFAKEKERWEAEKTFSDEQYKLQQARLALQAQEIQDNETLRRFIDAMMTEQKARVSENMRIFEDNLFDALKFVIGVFNGTVTTAPGQTAPEDSGSYPIEGRPHGGSERIKSSNTGGVKGEKTPQIAQMKNGSAAQSQDWTVVAPVELIVDGKVLADAVIKFGADAMRRNQRGTYGV